MEEKRKKIELNKDKENNLEKDRKENIN